MKKNRTYHKKKTVIVFAVFALMLLGLMGRMFYLMVIRSDYYSRKARNSMRGKETLKPPEAGSWTAMERFWQIIKRLYCFCDPQPDHGAGKSDRHAGEGTGNLGRDCQKTVETVSSIERVETNVEKEVGDRIRSYGLDGVKVDEDYKRSYPYNELASKVLGFTGGDNQGIVGLEVMYEEVLKGINGRS